MRVGRVVYWFITGACFGIGLDPWGFGILFFVGMVLVLVGAILRTGRESVAVVLGFGAGLAALLALLTLTDFQGGPPVALVVYGGLVISTLSVVIGLVALGVVSRRSQREAGPTVS